MESCLKHGKCLNPLESPCWVLDIECPMSVCLAGVMEIQRCFLFLVLKSETAYYCRFQKEQRLDLGLNLTDLKVFCSQMYVLIGKQTGVKKSFEINQIPTGIRKLPLVHFLPLCQLLWFCFWHASFEISLKIVQKFCLTSTNNFRGLIKALIKGILHRRLEAKG